MLDTGRGWASLFTGIIVLALGIIPFLETFGVISWGLPAFLKSVIGAIAMFLIAGIGVYLIVDALMEDHSLKGLTIVIGLIVIAIGLLAALAKFNIIGWSIPFLNYTVYNVIFIIEGIFLMIAGLKMR